MAKQQRRKHTAEFKREAVPQVEESNKSVTQVAAEFDIPRNTLNRWRKELAAEPTEAFRGYGRSVVMVAEPRSSSVSGISNGRTSV